MVDVRAHECVDGFYIQRQREAVSDYQSASLPQLLRSAGMAEQIGAVWQFGTTRHVIDAPDQLLKAGFRITSVYYHTYEFGTDPHSPPEGNPPISQDSADILGQRTANAGNGNQRPSGGHTYSVEDCGNGWLSIRVDRNRWEDSLRTDRLNIALSRIGFNLVVDQSTN